MLKHIHNRIYRGGSHGWSREWEMVGKGSHKISWPCVKSHPYRLHRIQIEAILHLRFRVTALYTALNPKLPLQRFCNFYYFDCKNYQKSNKIRKCNKINIWGRSISVFDRYFIEQFVQFLKKVFIQVPLYRKLHYLQKN